MRRGWGWPGFNPGFVGFGFGHRGRRRQWFGAGDMKYVILKLLKDKPRHGYEVMKDLEEQMHGCYSASPGTVYPTLQWLEDEGLVRAKDAEGKKVYEITDAGLKFLDEHRDVIEDIFDRVKDAIDEVLGGGMGDLNRAMGNLMRSAYRGGWRSRDDSIRQKISHILKKAAAEIDALMQS
ncbi:MAG TPA: helix-turn-helix transcriptional regulator [Gemmatimonadales bacterium]|nr:helix-turn-helix transcriptional regulator [Gemmatimonadales bacterium]